MPDDLFEQFKKAKDEEASAQHAAYEAVINKAPDSEIIRLSKLRDKAHDKSMSIKKKLQQSASQ